MAVTTYDVSPRYATYSDAVAFGRLTGVVADYLERKRLQEDTVWTRDEPSLIDRLRTRLEKAMARRRTAWELKQLSDAQLRDIGLARIDIDGYVAGL
jgi:uncharacterized protein YjiS (DUF1127 family)